MWSDFRFRRKTVVNFQYLNPIIPERFDGLILGKNLEIDSNVDIGYDEIQEPRCEYEDRIEIGDNVIIRSGAIIYIGCKIGNGAMIGHNTVIREACESGEWCRIGHLSSICGNVKIGHHTSIHDQVHITAHSIIGNHVFIGPRTVTMNDPFMSYHRKNIEPEQFKGVTILDGARIGAGCAIVPGITIGKEARVDAGSLVTKDVPDRVIVRGFPAHQSGFVSEKELLKNNGIDI